MPSSMWRERVAGQLERIRQQGLYRVRGLMATPQGAEVVRDGVRLVNFCSNDYLGLAGHPEVVAALQQGAGEYGAGSGASHLVCGHGRAHHALEEDLARFAGRSRALLFSTGYMANMGVIQALAGRGDRVFEDRLNHASLLDGARLSGARLLRYEHASPDALSCLMREGQDERLQLIASDGVFSMDGDVAPVARLAAVARQTGACLMIDDAHGLGVTGDGGGVIRAAGLSEEDVPVLVGTLGKAFGTFGAFVAGPDDLIDYLVQRARTYIYTTALPPAVAVATRTALRLAQEESWRRDRLYRLIRRFRSGAEQLGLRLLPSDTPIQPVLAGGNETALHASAALQRAGFLVTAIRPPTVPAGTARLRITLSAAHTGEQVDRLLDALAGLSLPDMGGCGETSECMA